MTDRFKEALDYMTDPMFPIYIEHGSKEFALIPSEFVDFIISAITLATEAEQLRKENEGLKIALSISRESCIALNKSCDIRDLQIIELQAKLDKAKTGLSSIARNTCCDRCQEAALVARTTLGELE
jgi:hypothetical protein